ncbi:MAG: YfiR family protein [Bacteroidota bacterium]
MHNAPFYIRCKLMLCLGILLTASKLLSAQRINHRVQSLFIYQFTKNIKWPPEAVDDTLVIVVFGNSPIVEELKKMASLKRAAQGRVIKVKQTNTVGDLWGAHIVYLSASKSRLLNTLVKALAKQPTLLVTERDGLARRGAGINFTVLENDTLRFEVNREVLSQHQLDMSPELLRLGFEVK